MTTQTPHKPNTDVMVQEELTSAGLTALLQEAGWAEKPLGNQLPRVTLDGSTLKTQDGLMFVYNPAKPSVPAATVRIVKPPEEYNGIWISETVARQFGRPDLAGSFSKKYYQHDDDREIWPSDEAYDELKARNDIVDDEGKPLRSSWKAEMQVQFIPESGTLTGNEPVYLMTLPTTSVIEWKGTSAAPEAGAVGEANFIRKLSLFAIMQNKGIDPKKAVLDALTALTLGGVAADVRLPKMENKELGRAWNVISFEPIHIEPAGQEALLSSGETA